MLSGDVEINPGPLSNCKEYFSICLWNLNSISAHGYSKLFLLKAYVILHKFDIICLPETYLDSIIPIDDNKLQIPGYTLIRSDHPSNTKHGWVCIYYKSSLPLRVIIIGYSHECWSFELLFNFVAHYRCPSQLNQIINEPTHILPNSSSCIDLIFTSQPNMAIESGIHSSLHSSYHHQTVFAKFNLKICYPPPYSRGVWHFKEANIDLIGRALNDFNWGRAFWNNVNGKCLPSINLFSRFWVTWFITKPYYAMIRIPRGVTRITSLLQAKNKVFKNYRNNKTNIQLLNKLNFLQEHLNGLITKWKSDCYERMAKKLNNLQRNSKEYWSLLKCFLTSKKYP